MLEFKAHARVRERESPDRLRDMSNFGSFGLHELATGGSIEKEISNLNGGSLGVRGRCMTSFFAAVNG